MIKSWRLKNFKSFYNLPRFNLAKINVLAGANSSGKSSIIQSILLLKQTVQYGSENRSLAFNGPLLRLGAFEDVRTSEVPSGDLEIGFEFELASTELTGLFMTPSARVLGRYLSGSDTRETRYLSLDLSYNTNVDSHDQKSARSPGPPSLTPIVTNAELRTSFAGTRETKGEAYLSFTTRASVKPEDDEWFRYTVRIDESSKEEIFLDHPKASVRGGSLPFLMPYWTLIDFDAAEARIRKLVDDLFNTSTGLIGGPRFGDERVPGDAVELINAWLGERGVEA